MSELTPLREAVDDLAGRSPSPDFSELKRRATRRGRRRVTAAAAVAVAIIVVGGGVAAGSLGGSDQPSPVGEPTTPSLESPTVSESAESSPAVVQDLDTQLDEILGQVPGWAIGSLPRFNEYDYAFNGPCSGDSSLLKDSNGAAGAGGASRGLPVGLGKAHFPSEAQASEAAATFVENLEACTVTAWRTQPIAQTGAVLALSAEAVTWIQQEGHYVDVLQVATSDGPPPVSVQVEVAEWMVAFITKDEQRRSTHS